MKISTKLPSKKHKSSIEDNYSMVYLMEKEYKFTHKEIFIKEISIKASNKALAHINSPLVTSIMVNLLITSCRERGICFLVMEIHIKENSREISCMVKEFIKTIIRTNSIKEIITKVKNMVKVFWYQMEIPIVENGLMDFFIHIDLYQNF